MPRANGASWGKDCCQVHHLTTIAVVLEDVTVDADTGEGSGGSSALTEHVAATVLAAEAWLAFHQGLGLHCNRHRASVTMSHPKSPTRHPSP